MISERFGPTTPCLALPPYNWTFTLKFYKRRVTENKILSSVDPQAPLDMGHRFGSSCQTAGVLGHYSTKRLDLAVRVCKVTFSVSVTFLYLRCLYLIRLVQNKCLLCAEYHHPSLVFLQLEC